MIKFHLYIVILATILLLYMPKSSFAQSSYVLPYPSAMPGGVFYKLNLIKEEFLKYWYFGDFGQFHFNLKQSDKYLVEAKTLFDYKQYFLANTALQKSDRYFEKIYPNLLLAHKNGKKLAEKEKILKNAAQKHLEELTKIRNRVPSVFEWTPEKGRPTKLNLWENFDGSIKLRQKRL